MSNPVACPVCGKHYRWKPDLAGRKVKCRCGEVFRMTDAAPANPPPPALNKTGELSEGYDLHDSHLDGSPAKPASKQPATSTDARGQSSTCPSCNQPLKAGAVLCINCGFNLQSGTQIKTSVGQAAEDDPPARLAGQALTGGASRVARALDEREDDTPAPRWKDLYLPLALILLGVGMSFVRAMYFGDPDLTPTVVQAVLSVAIKIAISVPILFVAMLIAVKLLDVAFGPLGQALFKLVAIALAPGAIGSIIETALGGGLPGWFAGFLVSLVAFWVLLSVLMDLDAMEALYMMMIVWLVQWIAGFLTLVVLGSLMA